MKRIISLSLAGLMASQTVAFAQTDRTSDLTNQAIAQSKANLSALRTNILALDKALAETATTIETRDNSGNILNGMSIAGAGLGVAFSAVSFMTARRGGNGSGFGMIIAGLIAASASGTSALMGSGSHIVQKDVDTKKISEELDALEKEIASNTQVMAAQDTKTLNILSTSIKDLRASLDEYQGKEDKTDKTKVWSHIGQVVGTAMVIYGLTDRELGSKIMTAGVLIMNASNVSRIVSGMTSSQAELVLKEISSARTTLQINAATLE